MDGASEQIGKQLTIKKAEFFAQPEASWQGVFDIEAIGLGRIKGQAKAQFNDQQGMFDQKGTELRGVNEAFADTQ